MVMLMLLSPTIILFIPQVVFDRSIRTTKEVTTEVSHTINLVSLGQTAILVQDIYRL